MAGKKKRQSAEFAKDKNAFAGGSSKKENSTAQKAKQKQSGAHQPRDADITSGHDVQKPGQSKTFGYGANHSVKQNDLKLRSKPERDSFQDNQSSFQSDAKKASEQKKVSGQKAKSGQKKRRQTGRFQKQNSFTEHKEKPDSGNAESKAQDGFSKEQNTFTEEGGGEKNEETKDDYRRRDTYHQNEKKGRYRRREHQDRERTKTFDFQRDYQTKNNAFAEKNTFTEGGEPEFQGNKKLDKLQKKAEKAGKKTEAARKNLQKKKEYSLERVFDEKTGRAKYVLTAVAKEKPFKEDSPVKRMAGRAGSEFTNYAHGKVAESEKENSAVEGAHKTEQKVEDTYRFVKRHYKSKEQRQRGKIAKLEKKQFKKEAVSYTHLRAHETGT